MLPFFKTGKAVIGPLDNHVRDNAFSISCQNCKSSWMVIFLFSFQWIIAFIRKGLKLDPADSLFVYVNQAFAPAPGKWPPPSKSDQDTTLTIMLCFVRSPEECKIYRIALVYKSNIFQFFFQTRL